MLKVTLLADEWGSSKGGLSTINRELAKQLAKLPDVEVTFFLPKCSEEDKNAARDLGVTIKEADERPGYEPVYWLAFPPESLSIDVVVGHGVKLGRQAQHIRKTHNCKWVQVVHTAPEELSMYKTYEGAVHKGEEKHQAEIKLCEMADFVVAIGPKLADNFSAYLRPRKKVFDLTPGIFDEFSRTEQASEDGRTFRVLVFGRGDSEDFELKGYDIAAQAVDALNDSSYRLIFVGAPNGKEEEVKKNLLKHNISQSQLTVRGFCESREKLSDLFCEADLAIMPSRTEGFGLAGVEALSAGLPILVSCNSGFGEALRKVPFGSNYIVDSEDANVWANAIKHVREKDRKMRLQESEVIRTSYAKQYDWQKQCEELVKKLRSMNQGTLPLFDDLQQLQQLKQMDHDFPLLNELKHKADEKGFIISHNLGAGNCMFFSLAEQLCLLKGITFYLQVGELRRKLVAFLQDNPKLANGTDLFNFVAGYPTWADYLKDMEKDGTWGDHVILLAAANCFQVPIRVISSQRNQDDLLILPEAPVDDAQPLVLGHIQELHYVSLQPKQGAPSPGHEHQRNPARPVQPPSSEVGRFVTFMKEKYIRRVQLQPVPWCDTSFLSFDRVYTRLTMETREMQSPELTSQEVDVYDIFCSHRNCPDPRSVLIEGNPGIGKTTFCQKLAKDWASGDIPPDCSFPKVEFLLLLKCRDMDGDLRKEVEDQLLPLDVTDQEKCHFWEFLQDNQEKLLIILDGLDELREQSRHDVDNLLLRRILPKCFLVVTARQERGIHVRKRFDTLLEIKGFTEDDAFLYIQRHFRDKKKESLATVLIEEIEENYPLYELLQNPLNTVLLCLVFEDCEGILPSTRTELYWSIIFCILKLFCTKQAVPFDDSTLIKQFEDVLVALGELALDGLKEDILYFSEKKLNSSTQQVPQMGFVFREASAKVIKSEHNYSFPHKTIQEFFAALYLAHMVKRDVKDDYKFVSCIDDITGKFKQVLLFVAGILREDGRRHFEMLGELITRKRNGNDHPWEFLMDSFEESGHIDKMAAALAPAMPLCRPVEINGSVHLNYFSYSRYRLHHKQYRSNAFLVVGDIILPSGLNKFLPESTSLMSLNVYEWIESADHQTGAVPASLGEGLSENTSITSLTLDLSSCNLSDAGLASLGEGLSENTSLTSLTLNLTSCNRSNAGLASLGEGLSENTSLTSLTLNLTSCYLSDAGLAPLGEGLSENTSLTSLTLDLSSCNLSGAGLASLGRGLSEKTSLTSLTLDLSFCNLSDAGLSSLGRGLSGNKFLTTPTLNFFCCKFDGDFLSSFGKGFSENTSLTSLTLDLSCCILSDADFASLRRRLLENTSLTSLSLHLPLSNRSDADLASLGRGLLENTSLTSLTLRLPWCNLSDAGLASLGRGLSENTSLTSLTLRLPSCYLSDAGLASLGRGLFENTSLTSLTLDMSLDGQSIVGLVSIEKGLQDNRSLLSLTLTLWFEDYSLPYSLENTFILSSCLRNLPGSRCCFVRQLCSCEENCQHQHVWTRSECL